MARKKVVKPTFAEAKKIKTRLQRQYPQMFEMAASPGTRKQLKKTQIMDASSSKALEKMVAKKLKKIYRSKK